MRNILKKIRGESGQAMLAALACFVLGGLVVTPVITYAGTSLVGVTGNMDRMKGIYAAEAGIEDVLWAFNNEATPATSLSQNMNGMQVVMETVNNGEYSMVAGQWVSANTHSDDLSIETIIAWDSEEGAYKYTITYTWSGPGNCKLIRVGTRLPVGYTYVSGSASLFGDNLSTGEPTDETDKEGAHILNWTFSMTDLEPTRMQIFYISGSGELEDYYSWAEATRQSVGEVGELSGAFYTLTSTATNPQTSKVNGTIVVDIWEQEGGIDIIAWKIEK